MFMVGRWACRPSRGRRDRGELAKATALIVKGVLGRAQRLLGQRKETLPALFGYALGALGKPLFACPGRRTAVTTCADETASAELQRRHLQCVIISRH